MEVNNMKDWTEIEYDASDLEVLVLNRMTDEEFEEYLRNIYKSKQ